MTRSKLLLAWGALLLGLSACEKVLESPASPAPTAQVKPTVSVSLSRSEVMAGTGDSIRVKIVANFENGLVSISPVVLDSSGLEVGNLFDTNFHSKPFPDAKGFSDSSWSLAPKPSTPPGEYKLKVRLLEKGSLDAIQELPFRVLESPVPIISGFSLQDSTLDPGMRGNSLGSVHFRGAEATIDYTIRGCDGKISVSPGSPYKVSTSPASLAKAFVVASEARPGTCTLSVSVTDERGRPESRTATFSIRLLPGTSQFVSAGSVELGFQRAAPGVYLGLAGELWPVTYTNGAGLPTDEIDLVLGRDGAGALALMSPKMASKAGYPKLAAWPVQNATKIRVLGVNDPTSLPAINDSDLQIAGISEGQYYAVYPVGGPGSIVRVNKLIGSGRSSVAELEFFTFKERFSQEFVLDSHGSLPLGVLSASPSHFLQILDSSKATAWADGPGMPTDSIDMVFGLDGSGILSLMSPRWAGAQGFDLSSWPQQNSASICDFGSKLPLEIDAVRQALDTIDVQSAPVSEGHYYGIKTHAKKYEVFFVSKLIRAGDESTATIQLFRR